MALRNGLDTIAIASFGVYTETYASGSDQENVNNLYASKGFLEDAPEAQPYLGRVRLFLQGVFK